MAWWYTGGLHQCLMRIKGRLDSSIDYFSISLLIRTLFAPFRQISAGEVDGPLGVRMQAGLDRLFSRCIGAVVRLIVMMVGLIAIALNAIAGIILVVLWLLLPLLPLVGLILFISGWLPWSS